MYSLTIRKSQVYSEDLSFKHKNKPEIKGIEKIYFSIFLILIFIFFLCPFISIFFSARNSFFKVITNRSFGQAVLNTFITGIFTGFFCTLTGFVFSVFVKLKKLQGNSFVQSLPLIPMAISSVVISIAAGLIFHKGSVPLLVLLETLLYWPIAYRQIQSGINKITADTDKAARIFSRNSLDSILRVYIPSCIPVLFSAFGYCFSVSAGDATIPLILSIHNFNTLALYTYRLAGAYRFNQACVCGFLLFILCFVIFSFLNKFKNHLQKKYN